MDSQGKILCFIFLVIFGSALSEGHSHPEISGGSEIIIEEGQTLHLTCTGNKKIVFSYPENYHPDRRQDSYHQTTNITISRGTSRDYDEYIQHFYRVNAQGDDTGYYGCAYAPKEIDRNSQNQPDVAWTFVYVKSSSQKYVTIEPALRRVRRGHTAIIPCIPTSPDYSVFLYRNNREITPKRRPGLAFDPKSGFHIPNISRFGDEGSYECRIGQKNDMYLDVFYVSLIVYN